MNKKTILLSRILGRILALLGGCLLCATPVIAITISSLTQEREALPGESYTGTIEVVNNGDKSTSVQVHQTDYLFQSDGSNSFGPAGEFERSNAGWIDFSPNRIVIPPHETHRIDYTVSVPDNDSLSGTFWSMLMVEEIDSDSSPNRPADNQAAISQVVRYGVQCITQIGMTGISDLQVIGAELSMTADNTRELHVDVKNSGNRWAVPIAWVELYDENGQSAGRFECEKKRIFPSTSVRFRIQLADSLQGKYKALVVVDSGGENVLGAKYDLEF
ncbi:hypothetical protein KKC97_09240 [bacterium]|nr:hypothetical protein [bacterium]MBU1637835.1 hypothetical protein [bacterium]MBU1919706.1 hypothetical protein [bacterium]